MNGVLVLDKPPGQSSAAAVDHVKQHFGVRRAGHGGTLDPIATGVLPICLGEATKLAPYLLADDKAYEAELVLGIETDTLDRTGAVTATLPTDHVTRDAILAKLAARTGAHDQVPPMYSAIKQGGVRLYQRARAGEDVERAPRRVRIDRLELLELALPRLRVVIECSKGTYVRSLIADLGTDLGCGAHMSALRRTRCGAFTIGEATSIDHLDQARIIPLAAATRLPVVVAPDELVAKIRSGVQLPVEAFGLATPEMETFQMVAAGDTLIAIGHARAGRVIYDRVFVTPKRA